MYISTTLPVGEPVGTCTLALPGAPSIGNITPRGLHARLLTNAALRRRRSQQRRAEARLDDARYWMHAAFAAVAKASEARTTYARLP